MRYKETNDWLKNRVIGNKKEVDQHQNNAGNGKDLEQETEHVFVMRLVIETQI